MNFDTEGIVLRQTQTVNGRRMIVILTEDRGKLSCGTSMNEGGKNKTALALRPFCRGRYSVYRSRDLYSLNGAETIRSYFEIGEDVEKYIASSYILELIDRLLPEAEPSPAYYRLLLSFLESIKDRKRSFETLVIACQIKLLQISGCAPALQCCARCGRELAAFENGGERTGFSVQDGGPVCRECTTEHDALDALFFEVESDIINCMAFFENHPFSSLQKLALKPETENGLRRIMKYYISHHLGVKDLKSEELRI